ncbi:MAG: hypothetical protein J6P97_03120 [Bacteroidales bacterium]|nr:hypothetical protein [Bacteroidales bacterium]
MLNTSWLLNDNSRLICSIVLKENNYFSLSRWNLGVGMIAGFELKCGLQFNVNYKYAMFNSLQNADVANMIENTASIGIGYRF